MFESIRSGVRRRGAGSGGWLVPGLVLGLALGLAMAGAAPGGAVPVLGDPAPARAGMAPLAATRVPPAGSWRALHGPVLAPLWTTDPPQLRGLHVIETPAGLLGLAVGAKGALARYDGQAWAKLDDLDPKKTSPLSYDLNDVFIVAPDDIWVAAAVSGDRQCGAEACGALLHFDGQRWSALDRTSYGLPGRVPPMRAIDMLQDGSGAWYGWVVGDDLLTDTLKALILRYKDGKWRVWSGPNNFARHLQEVRILAPGEAWLVGLAGIESWYTEREDGVGDWAALGKSGADDLHALDLADPLYGWDGGAGGRMNRYQGHCHDEDPGSQCWFDNQARPIRDRRGLSMSQDVNAIDLLSREEGWLVGAASARRSLVAYLDGENQMWSAVEVASDPGTSLFGLQMLDARRGFAVGDKGVILAYRDDSLPSATPSPEVPPPSATPSPSPTASPEPPPASATPSGPPPTSPSTPTPPSPSATPTGPPSATPTTPAPSATATVDSTVATPPTAVPEPPRTIYLPLATKQRRAGR